MKVYTEPAYATGHLRTFTGGGRRSTTDRVHAIEIDHRYGPHGHLAWGRSLCGLVGRVEQSGDYTEAEMVMRILSAPYACGSCRRSAKARRGST